MTITTERAQEIIAGCESATPGPWETRGADSPNIYLERHYSFRAGGYGIHNMSERQACRDAAHIAACDPDTIRDALTELLALREALTEIIDADRDFRSSMAPDVAKDPVTLACDRASSTLSNLKGLSE